MANKLSIDGVIFQSSKEIDSSNPYEIIQPQSKGLSWDSGSVPGENITYSLKAPCIRAVTASRCASGFPSHTKWWYLFPGLIDNRWLRPDDVISYQSVKANRNCRFDTDHRLAINGTLKSPFNARIHNDASVGGDGDLGAYSGGQGVSSRNFIYWVSLTSSTYQSGKIVISGSDNDGEYDLIDPNSIQAVTEDICLLIINHEDGSHYEFGEVPCDAEIFLVEEECCPKATRIADAILKKLGQRNEL